MASGNQLRHAGRRGRPLTASIPQKTRFLTMRQIPTAGLSKTCSHESNVIHGLFRRLGLYEERSMGLFKVLLRWRPTQVIHRSGGG